MNELLRLNESVVEESEIDSLGHMNVRFYLSRVAAANIELMKRVGVEPAPDQFLRRVDTYSRFRNEQFAGATLHTCGGVIQHEPQDGQKGVRAYFEIRNPETAEIAASFHITSSLVDTVGQVAVGIPNFQARIADYVVTVPDHGMPRSLSLAPPSVVEFAVLENAVGDEPTPGMMSGRKENVIYEEDCDAAGRLREDIELMFAVHRSPPGHEGPNFGPEAMQDKAGRRYGWAMMETRNVTWNRPMAGDQIVSLGADIAFTEKSRQSRRWMFVKESGQPLGVSDTLGICINLDERRAMTIPDEIRGEIEANYLPQFA